MSKPSYGPHTRAIHAGEPDPRPAGAAVAPIFQSSTFLFEGHDAGYEDVHYARLSNTPTHDVLHAKLAALENAEAGLATASGMAAISSSLLTFLKQGDHLLAQDSLYGGTHMVVHKDLPALGIEVTTYDAAAPEALPALVRPNTKVIYAETMTNPLVRVGELDALARFGAEHGLVSMIDNTFASPTNFRPAEHGFDLALHSATKYLNGHTDLIAGAVMGKADHVEAVRHRSGHLGGSLDAHACFLLHRGIKTLPLRMERHASNAQHVAEFLAAQEQVVAVNYPGLPSSPSHAAASRLLDTCSGMLSFEVAGGRAAAYAVQDALQIPLVAPSLGGLETLVTLPAETSHVGMTPEEREAAGVADGLIRVSIGLEDADDLIADFGQALGA
ncbi:MAG: PLP-dependent transferase [Acidobacteria bacterium]|nr:PLP-dependent transferase [Acidobacteriota bacterium]